MTAQDSPSGRDGAGRVLAVNVALRGADGRVKLWRRGASVPPQLAGQLGGHVFVGGEHVLTAPERHSVERARELAVSPGAYQRHVQATGASPVQPVVRPTERIAPSPAPQADPAGEREPISVLPAAPATDAEQPVAPATPMAPEPPRSGPGATREAWHQYARALGQDVAATAGRDAVVAQLLDTGLIDPQP